MTMPLRRWKHKPHTRRPYLRLPWDVTRDGLFAFSIILLLMDGFFDLAHLLRPLDMKLPSWKGTFDRLLKRLLAATPMGFTFHQDPFDRPFPAT